VLVRPQPGGRFPEQLSGQLFYRRDASDDASGTPGAAVAAAGGPSSLFNPPLSSAHIVVGNHASSMNPGDCQFDRLIYCLRRACAHKTRAMPGLCVWV
jgi:hypothetical protein